MMLTSAVVAVVCFCVTMVTVDGLPSLITNAYNNHPYINEELHPAKDYEKNVDERMEVKEYNRYESDPQGYDSFNSNPIAFMSTLIGKYPYSKVAPTDSPYSAIGKLINTDGSSCTGAFIRSTVFLTAAHCLHTGGAGGHAIAPSKIYQKKGCDGSTGKITHFLNGQYVPANWINHGDRNSDYALVFTKKSSGVTLDMKPITNLAGKSVKLAGYPSLENPKDCMMESACKIIRRDPNYAGRFYYDCDTSPGMSGGPVRDDKDDIVGIDNRGFLEGVPVDQRFNKALWLTAAVKTDIENHIP